MAQNTPTPKISWGERFKKGLGRFAGRIPSQRQNALTHGSSTLPIQQVPDQHTLTQEEAERARFERAAQELEQFDDGKVEVEQWFQRKYVLFFAIVAPLVLTYWLGYENGYAFSGRDYDWNNKVVMANYWIG